MRHAQTISGKNITAPDVGFSDLSETSLHRAFGMMEPPIREHMPPPQGAPTAQIITVAERISPSIAAPINRSRPSSIAETGAIVSNEPINIRIGIAAKIIARTAIIIDYGRDIARTIIGRRGTIRIKGA